MRPQTLVSTEVFISKPWREGFNSGKAHVIEPYDAKPVLSDEL